MLVSDIDFSRVPQKVIEKFFRTENLETLEELIPVCYTKEKEPYSRHQKEYIVPFSLDRVWAKYVFLHPCKYWNSDMISFGFMYSRTEDKVLYPDSTFGELEPGQLFFISLNIVGTILQIPVMHEIDQVDHEAKVIKTCYLKNGKSEGSQWIRFYENGDKSTRIVHETIYKGDSKIREKYLYPIFHTKAINQFHANFYRELSQEASILSTNS